MWIAAQNGHADVCKLLLKNRAEVDSICSEMSMTPLLIAARNGHTDVCNLLLDNSANIEATNKQDETPLFMAARHNHPKVCKLLLDSGANANHGVKFRITPLRIAAERGYLDVCTILLDKKYGVNINSAEEKCNTTPLWIATEKEHINICRLLLNKGADRDHPRCDGKKPLHVALETRNEHLIALFLEKEGHTTSKNVIEGIEGEDESIDKDFAKLGVNQSAKNVDNHQPSSRKYPFNEWKKENVGILTNTSNSTLWQGVRVPNLVY